MEKGTLDSGDPPSYNDVTEKLPTAPSSSAREFQPMLHNSQGPPMGFHQPQPVHQQQPHVIYAPGVGQGHLLQQPGTTVIINCPQNYGPHAQHVTCPSCGARIQTQIIAENSYTTHFLAFILCILGCFCFSCIPYLIDSCKNKSHYCPECKAYLGTYYINTPQGRGHY